MKDHSQFLYAMGPALEGQADFYSIFNDMPLGVMATNAEGIITYYNDFQSKIDSLDRSFALGRHVTKVYGPDPGPSLVMTSLEKGQAIINFVCVYRTAHGKLVNSSHCIYPFFNNGQVTGCLCFIQSFITIDVNPPSVSSINELGAITKKPISFDRIVGRNLDLQKALNAAAKAAQTPSPVLIFGETGTGKEMFASSIHNASSRKSKPFVAINCAAIPENLLEGILFGTSKGAFTGAMEKKGLFEEANGGSIFLDEVDSMPLVLQPKLLRVLQEKKVRRIGSAAEIALDLKIISASSVSPLLAVEHGKMRADLFYRLGVVLINIPPLRNRIDDLEELLTFFILKHNTILSKKVVHFSRDVIKFFRAYHWPGNIRELEHLVEGALNLAGNQTELGLEMLPDHFQEKVTLFAQANARQRQQDAVSSAQTQADETKVQDEQEKAEIIEVMKSSFGNSTLAAKLLGISRQLLSYRLKKYGINKRQFKI